jgi:hypothetical protein
MGLTPFPKASSLWVIARKGGQIDRVTYAPIGKREGAVHVYKFPMPGLGFSLAVSKNVPLKYRDICVVHGNGTPVIVTTILEAMLMEEAMRLGQKSLHLSLSVSGCTSCCGVCSIRVAMSSAPCVGYGFRHLSRPPFSVFRTRST